MRFAQGAWSIADRWPGRVTAQAAAEFFQREWFSRADGRSYDNRTIRGPATIGGVGTADEEVRGR